MAARQSLFGPERLVAAGLWAGAAWCGVAHGRAGAGACGQAGRANRRTSPPAPISTGRTAGRRKTRRRRGSCSCSTRTSPSTNRWTRTPPQSSRRFAGCCGKRCDRCGAWCSPGRAEVKNKPAPEQLVVSCFNGQDDTAHTWWNPRTIKEAAPPEVSADGCTYSYAIPVDTWGVVAAVRGPKEASAFAVPALQAFVPDQVEADGRGDRVGLRASPRAAAPMTGASRPMTVAWRNSSLWGEIRATKITAAAEVARGRARRSRPAERGEGRPRRSVQFRLLYIGDSRWRRVWPYHAQPEDVARTIVTSVDQVRQLLFPGRRPRTRTHPGSRIRLLRPRHWDEAAARPAPALPPTRRHPKELLTTKVDAIPGVPLVRGWSTGVIPWFGANPSARGGPRGRPAHPGAVCCHAPLA